MLGTTLFGTSAVNFLIDEGKNPEDFSLEVELLGWFSTVGLFFFPQECQPAS